MEPKKIKNFWPQQLPLIKNCASLLHFTPQRLCLKARQNRCVTIVLSPTAPVFAGTSQSLRHHCTFPRSACISRHIKILCITIILSPTAPAFCDHISPLPSAREASKLKKSKMGEEDHAHMHAGARRSIAQAHTPPLPSLPSQLNFLWSKRLHHYYCTSPHSACMLRHIKIIQNLCITIVLSPSAPVFQGTSKFSASLLYSPPQHLHFAGISHLYLIAREVSKIKNSKMGKEDQAHMHAGVRRSIAQAHRMLREEYYYQASQSGKYRKPQTTAAFHKVEIQRLLNIKSWRGGRESLTGPDASMPLSVHVQLQNHTAIL